MDSFKGDLPACRKEENEKQDTCTEKPITVKIGEVALNRFCFRQSGLGLFVKEWHRSVTEEGKLKKNVGEESLGAGVNQTWS